MSLIFIHYPYTHLFFIMKSNYFPLLSFIFLILLFSPFPLLSTLSTSNHQQITKNPSSVSPPFDFLKPLIGTHKGQSAKGISQLKKYFSKIGFKYKDYIHNTTKPPHENDDYFDDTLELFLISFQSYFQLKVNGLIDDQTVKQLMRPRCGVPDSGNFRDTHNNFQGKIPIISSHYTFFPGTPKWSPTKRNLTYSISPRAQIVGVNNSISRALDLWASVSPFRFTYVSDYDRADIKIGFRSGDPFDGPGGFLAQAFEPSDGRVYFDGDEKWADGVKQGAFDLQTVGLHQLGHILGLGHTTSVSSIMYPYFGDGLRKGLDQEDIKGIRDLYPY
ncbi:hypothetical protein CASFOL_034179 [Castilleja foliolosa]|uniref:Peptidase metallopeptidase domain-containing protein n=1 Tax=Castilleja foliolosa TaxID=1961234 RepID=A0ABD3BWW9_9LAMI